VVSDEHADEELPPAVLLMGPTASGKTAAALELAERFPIGLISVDSAQVYRGLDIGSAKPEPECLESFPHELIDLRDPEQSYSAAEFVCDCGEAMRRIAGRGRLPLLVGGTMMYFRALLYGLDDMPSADHALRRTIEEEAARRGWAGLYRELARADPGAAAIIDPADRQRIVRAIEVLRRTGHGPSRLRRNNRIAVLKTLRLVLAPPRRHVLHDGIAKRFNRMLQQGFLDEVRALRGRCGVDSGCAAIRSVGYRQAWEMMDGAFEPDELPARVQAATRQLAKRQLTALRRMSRSLWYDPNANGTIERIFRHVEAFYGRSTANGVLCQDK
jgi:tRNA dimethylallyltransferase